MSISVLIVIASALAILTAALLVGAYVAYRMAFYNDPKKKPADPYRHIKDDGSAESELSKSLIDKIISTPCENIYVTSHDGLRLRARLYIKDENAPFAIQMHGYKSTPMLDLSGGSELAMEYGFNVILPDQRACGESEGKTISFGFFEHKDVYAWIDYVRKRWGEERKIVLFGVSLGAGTVVMSAGSGLPDNVVAVAADCPFSSAKEIITKVIYDMGLSGKLLYPFARLGGKIYGGFDPNLSSPKETVKGAAVPILLIHGEDDSFVPPEMSRMIERNNQNATLHTFPSARHGKSYIVDRERYKKIAFEFLDRVLGEK